MDDLKEWMLKPALPVPDGTQRGFRSLPLLQPFKKYKVISSPGLREKMPGRSGKRDAEGVV
jgi:hypothetical protein